MKKLPFTTTHKKIIKRRLTFLRIPVSGTIYILLLRYSTKKLSADNVALNFNSQHKTRTNIRKHPIKINYTFSFATRMKNFFFTAAVVF